MKNRMYHQKRGLFMGYLPCPKIAVMQVYSFERRSIYGDLDCITDITKATYRRYMDDVEGVAVNEEETLKVLNMIAQQDPDQRIAWELDFQKDNTYFPFLDTELFVDDDGVLHMRYYRKPQKKSITLHVKSHHLSSTKTEMVRNYYRTAQTIASGPEELQHSMEIVDGLLRKNGYSNPRNLIKKVNQKKKQTNNVSRPILELPYISDRISAQIRNHCKKLKIHARIIFKPGSKLTKHFCNSRPHDYWKCVVTNNKAYVICPDTQNNTYSTKNVVYEITCRRFNKRYIGETERLLHDRMLEHRRAATKPDKHPNNALAKHYSLEHPSLPPLLNYKVLKSHLNSDTKRKIADALFIRQLKPELNARDEMNYISRLLV